MSKSTFVHAIPARFTSLICVVTPSSPRRAGNPRRNSGSSPTETSAPGVMSPETPLKGCRIAIGILRAVRGAGAGVEHDDLGVVSDPAVARHLTSHRQGTSAFRRRIDPGRASELDGRGADRVLRDSDRVTAALTHGPQNQPVSERTWYSQSGGMRTRILPGRRAIRAGGERAYDGRATAGLGDDHPREFRAARKPANRAQLTKDFPHPDESRASTGRINDMRRQVLPIELLGELQPHRL